MTGVNAVSSPSPDGRAAGFDPLAPEIAKRWSNFLAWDDRMYFPQLIGLEVEELRMDYARLRLPWREENTQPAGIIHGGAIATIIDSVVVPAIGVAYDGDMAYSTIDLAVQYLRPLASDAVGEGWVVKRGRSIVFTQAEVFDDQGRTVALGTATYAVKKLG